MSVYKKWSSKEYTLGTRLAVTLLIGGFLFVFLIPSLLLSYGPDLDHRFNLPSLNFGIINMIIGSVAILVGLFFALWSIVAQITLGKGTPIPAMATQKLLIVGLFKYCRNPMSLGTILGYSGIAIFIGSISAFLMVSIFTILLILYIAKLEEKELEERFGNEYQDYKRTTNFIIPKFK